MRNYNVKELTQRLYPLLFLLLFSCVRNGQKALSVEVTMSHIPPSVHTAYLDQITPAATYTIDTAEVNVLTGSILFSYYPQRSEGLYAIRLNDSSRILLALGDRSVTVAGDYDRPGDLEIKGSPSSAELQRFLETLNRRNHQLHSLLEDYDTLKKARVPDSVLRRKMAVIEESRHSLLDTILEQARTTHSAVNAVFALSILDNAGSWEEGKTIFSGLEQRFPDNRLVQQAAEAYHRKLNDEGRSIAVGVGDMAPDISYPDTTGKVLSLHHFRGKYVLLDFWASWCAPCRAENPELVKAWRLFKGKDFAILSVSLDTKKSSWEKAIDQDKLTWDHISDLKGWNSAPAALYGVEAIPANFLIDPAGKIIAVNLAGDSLMHRLKDILPAQ